MRISQARDRNGDRTALTFVNIKSDLVALVEATLNTRIFDFAHVQENVGAAVALDKPVPFVHVEPFYDGLS